MSRIKVSIDFCIPKEWSLNWFCNEHYVYFYIARFLVCLINREFIKQTTDETHPSFNWQLSEFPCGCLPVPSFHWPADAGWGEHGDDSWWWNSGIPFLKFVKCKWGINLLKHDPFLFINDFIYSEMHYKKFIADNLWSLEVESLWEVFKVWYHQGDYVHI